MSWLHTVWHKSLRRPFRLHFHTDQGTGPAVVLLHGIASTGGAWQRLTKLLADQPCRVLAPDLLGFGKSPKPGDDWVRYSTEDHARAVLASLRAVRSGKPIILVGHSMGCLVAIRIAHLRPDLVKQLILYEPPFFEAAAGASTYKRQHEFYTRLYRTLVTRPPKALRSRFAQKLIARTFGFELTDATWLPFERSMKHTILEQTAVSELQALTVPTAIIYGRFDRMVINDKKRFLFDAAAEHITASEIPELHAISTRASRMIARRIRELTTP